MHLEIEYFRHGNLLFSGTERHNWLKKSQLLFSAEKVFIITSLFYNIETGRTWVNCRDLYLQTQENY